MEANRANINQIIADIMDRKRAALLLAGAQVQSQAKALCVVGKYPAGSGIVGGALRNSIYLKVVGNQARIGSNMVYAAMQEFGGPVVPVYAKALTIPISPAAIGHRAADFPGLFMIKREGKPPVLARKNGEEIEVMYVLLKKVMIPRQPYLRPALEAQRKNVIKILQAA